MSVLLVADERCLDHDPGGGHPERPARYAAALAALEGSDLVDAVVAVESRAATADELARVHPKDLIDRVDELAHAGGGRIDVDTVVSAGSFAAATHAAGAGLVAVERLDAGDADAAFCAVRPPGHHATASTAMGFCLFNSAAIAAATLAERGERVAIVDYDAHHGNGTQDIFYDDPRVLYISTHQHPLYPGTGAMGERGTGPGVGTTLNIPFPPGAAGDVYRAVFDDVVVPAVEAFEPSWLIISAGFDAHRADPLTGLALTAGDFADLTARLVPVVGAGRRLAFLEGGYDLEALTRSTAACLGALAGIELRPEPASSAGPGMDTVVAARKLFAE